MDIGWSVCPHFGDCGGCDYQDVPYPEQLERKGQSVVWAFESGGFPAEVIEDPIAPGAPLRYRNKMEFTFDSCGRPGLHRKGQYRSIVPIETCQLCSEDMERVLVRVAGWSAAWNLSGYDKRERTGLLRHLGLRSSVDGDLLVAIYTSREKLEPHEERAIAALEDELHGLPVRSLLWVVNPARADAAVSSEGETTILSGSDHIIDRLSGFEFRIGVDTFFQINPAGAETLIEVVRELAMESQGSGFLLDLFSGVGTFSLPLARDFAPEPVVGIEIVPSSVASARENAARNGLNNAHFVESDARRGMPEVIDTWGTPGRILLDPPRSGAGGKVMRRIGRAETDRVIYVSCNPESLIVDAGQLADFRYRISRAIPVDMFPQTAHVECVALFTRHGVC